MNIVLFTPYSPVIGGGSVQLRSHISHLAELNVQWCYLAGEPVAGKNWRCIGRPLTPLQFALDMSARAGLPGSTSAVSQITDRLHADIYWVVGHYEGISVADELLARGKTVHLTIHDEPLAMLIRSRRFRPLWPLMARVFPRVLRGAKSVDVTSTAMRDYLKRKYNVDSFTVYKYLPELPLIKSQVSEDTLTVGHIGSLYHRTLFRQFVLACRELARAQKRSFKIVRIGGSPEMDTIAAENLASFELHGELLEEDALPLLAGCDFVYAMYPYGIRFRGFRRTSLPIKLSTYIQAQRPIFAHTPPDSGLAQVVGEFNVGKVCSSRRQPDIRKTIEDLLRSRFAREDFEKLRVELMSENQLDQLRMALTIQV
jgi:hypothetical protein